MLLSKTPKDFRKTFLLKLTEQLIRNSAPIEILEIKQKAEDKLEKQELQEKIKSEIKTSIEPIFTKQISAHLPKSPVARRRNKIIMRPLIIPEQRLPPQFQYLRPTPTGKEIDLGKLNPLIKDRKVSSIECNGPDTNVIVRIPNSKNTSIILSKEEINDIVQRVSKAAKIPADEGIFKVVVGKLIFSAIISEVVGSRFIIKKMGR